MINGSYNPNTKPMSSIEWTGQNRWNFITGCSKVKGAAGCQNCYAEQLALKLKREGNPRYKNGFNLTIHRDKLDHPKYWTRPSLCFVNSMSDMFHEGVPNDVIIRAFEVMNNYKQHHFQILTKRPYRVLEIAEQLTFSPNIWMGVSVGTNARLNQIELLKKIPAQIRFVSYEPLLTMLKYHDLTGIDWAIPGGESPGVHGMRPSKIEYFTELIKNCDDYGVSVFVKQLGGMLGREYKMSGKHYYKGGDFSKFPVVLQRREFPIEVKHLY